MIDKYMIEAYRNRRSNQTPENRLHIKEIIWLDYMVNKLDKYSQLYYKDEEKRLCNKPYTATIDKRLENCNCAYENTLQFNKVTSFRKLKYWLKDTVFADYIYALEKR